MQTARNALDALLQWLAPARCPGCDLEVGRAGFCAGCAPLIERAPEGLWPRPAASASAAFDYGGPIADAIAGKLSSSSQSIAETAVLALGLLARDEDLDALAHVALGDDTGATLVRATEIPWRTRAFALHALALLRAHTANEVVRERVEALLVVCVKDARGAVYGPPRQGVDLGGTVQPGQILDAVHLDGLEALGQPQARGLGHEARHEREIGHEDGRPVRFDELATKQHGRAAHAVLHRSNQK